MKQTKKEPIEVRFFESLLGAIARIATALFNLKSKRVDLSPIADGWQRVETLSKTGNLNESRLAVLEADKLLDRALVLLSVSGGSLGEKLKVAERKFLNREAYQAAWQGHRTRNRIAHEDSQVDKAEINEALANFRRALRGLGAAI